MHLLASTAESGRSAKTFFLRNASFSTIVDESKSINFGFGWKDLCENLVSGLCLSIYLHDLSFENLGGIGCLDIW